MIAKKGGVAERQGFEPLMELPPYHLSKVAPSTARPALRVRIAPGFVLDGAFSRPALAPRAFGAQNAPPEPFVPLGSRLTHSATFPFRISPVFRGAPERI